MVKPDVATFCPRCGSASVPIVYGLPAPELFAAADRGEVALGGCLVFDDDPQFQCRGVDCGIEFAEPTATAGPGRASPPAHTLES